MKLPTTSPATWVKDMKENLVFSSENHWHSGQSHKKNNRTIREIKRGHKSLKGKCLMILNFQMLIQLQDMLYLSLGNVHK